MRILAFAASNSSKSINKTLVTYATSLLQEGSPDVEIDFLDINDFEMPLYSSDREEESGIPELAKAFRDRILAADAIIISFAEHNGSYTAAFKNLFDWTSRLDVKVFPDKAMVLLATSPGPGGAGSVLKTAKGSIPFWGGDIKASLSLPSYWQPDNSKANPAGARPGPDSPSQRGCAGYDADPDG